MTKLFSAKSYNSPQLLNTIKQRYFITKLFYYINTIYPLYTKYITNIYLIYYRYNMNTTNQTQDKITEEKFIGNVAHPCKVCGILTHEFRVVQYVKPAITFRYFTCDECDKGKVI